MLLLVNSTNHLREMIPICHNVFKKIKTDFLTHSVSPITKQDKDITRQKKLQTNIYHEHRCKNPQQNIRKLYPTVYKKHYTPQPRGIYFIRSLPNISSFPAHLLQIVHPCNSLTSSQLPIH